MQDNFKFYKHRPLRDQLWKESEAVRESSLEVLLEFENLEEGLREK